MAPPAIIMNEPMAEPPHITDYNRTVYHRGATDGLIMGLYLTVMYLLQVTGMNVPALSLLGEVMMLCVPVVAYLLMSRGARETVPRPMFSAMWMHGIMIFLCGSIIMTLAAYIYMRIVDPDFIVNLFRSMSQLYAGLGTEAGDQFSHMLDKVIAAHMLPTPISFAFSLLWLGSFSGAMLSLVIAGILKWRIVAKSKRNTTTDK